MSTMERRLGRVQMDLDGRAAADFAVALTHVPVTNTTTPACSAT